MANIVVPRTAATVAAAIELAFPSWPAWARVYIQRQSGPSSACDWIVAWPGNIKCIDPPGENTWTKWEPILKHLAPGASVNITPEPIEAPEAPIELPVIEPTILSPVRVLPLIPSAPPPGIAPSELSRTENAFPNLFARWE